jgi:hypothetical protein
MIAQKNRITEGKRRGIIRFTPQEDCSYNAFLKFEIIQLLELA